MVLWIVFALLAVISLALVCRPLLTGSAPLVGGSDEVVYAAQLEEIEADRARGVIGTEEAQAARTEVARRLLRAHRAGDGRATASHRRWVTAAALVLLIPAATVGAYLTLGMPGYGDRPLAARQTSVETDIARLVSDAEARLARHPEEGEGWASLAPMYLRMRRFDDAADAYERAAAILGETPALLTGRGQALMFAAGGTVTDEALALFERASAAEPDAAAPQIFLAVAARQRGNLGDAAQRWRTILEGTDGTEPWLTIARSEIAALQQADESVAAAALSRAPTTQGVAPEGPGAPSSLTPPPAAMAAIAALPAEQRAAQIEGMVENLASRLTADGGSVEEWVRLVRSYRVLGREDDARAGRDRGACRPRRAGQSRLRRRRRPGAGHDPGCRPPRFRGARKLEPAARRDGGHRRAAGRTACRAN